LSEKRAAASKVQAISNHIVEFVIVFSLDSQTAGCAPCAHPVRQAFQPDRSGRNAGGSRYAHKAHVVQTTTLRDVLDHAVSGPYDGGEMITKPPVFSGMPTNAARLLKAAETWYYDAMLKPESSIIEIAATYVRRNVMPADPVGDALHLTIASFPKCDFLVTWNCLHITNANKFGHIRRVNSMLGPFVPALVTPLELIGAEDEPDNT
jgi:hypothetical protein